MPTAVTREDYFETALELLREHGVAGVRISALCKALGITTGSFYNYFGSLDGFIEQLMEYVEDSVTDHVIELSSAPDDSIERLDMMKRLVLNVRHEAEAAIRAWGSSNPTIASAQKRIDKKRYDALLTVITDVVPDHKAAELLAIMGVTLLVGMQQWRAPVSAEEFSRVLDEYRSAILAHAPGFNGRAGS
ncbi:TetR/AcrR family transcriptional regulator [Streptomyces sp. NPDC002324]